VTSGPTRRAVLTSGLAGLLSACTTAPRRRTTPAAPDPDLALTAAAVARERVLLAAYDAVLATTPALAAQLGPLRADHLVHLAALGASPTPPPCSTRHALPGVVRCAGPRCAGPPCAAPALAGRARRQGRAHRR